MIAVLARRIGLWSLVILFPAPLLIAMNMALTDVREMKIYISLGLLAYSWWLLAILLSVRPRWLDRRVGLAHIYALHGVLGILAIMSAYLHRGNTFAANNLVRNLGDWAFWGSLIVLCYSVFFLSGWLTDRVRPLAKVRRWLEVVFRHQISVWLHRLNLVAVALIWLHVHLIDRISQHFWFMALFDTYTVTVLAVWAWKKWVAPDSYPAGQVAHNTALNNATRRIQIVLDNEIVTARPGDFYFLRMTAGPTGREWHPFSATDADTRNITFTIRQTGDYTRTIAQVPIGTRVQLEGPFGRFDQIVQDHPDDAPLVLIGMGAGIAPLLSLAEAYHATRDLRVLWSVRRPEDAYYSDLLEQYQAASNGRLRTLVQVGRFRRRQLGQLLTPDEIEHGAYLVVGPNPAVLSTQRTLWRAGIAPHRVHHERLTM